MSSKISLKEAERKAFRTSFEDGLWDIFIGCVAVEFAIAPFLSPSLGDFWSSAVFLPFWGLAMLIIWLVRRYVVTPRIGRVKFGRARRTRLKKFSVVMLVTNLGALLLGAIAALSVGPASGQVHSAIFGLIVLIGFSAGAYFLDFTRLYVYGALIALSPLVGEWLHVQWNVPHHGFPITFGATASAMIVTGLVIFARLVRAGPAAAAELPSVEA